MIESFNTELLRLHRVGGEYIHFEAYCLVWNSNLTSTPAGLPS